MRAPTTLFREPMLHLHAHDVDALLSFHARHHGYRETFRASHLEQSDHLEGQFDAFVSGMASTAVGGSTHGRPRAPGLSRPGKTRLTDDLVSVQRSLKPCVTVRGNSPWSMRSVPRGTGFPKAPTSKPGADGRCAWLRRPRQRSGSIAA